MSLQQSIFIALLMVVITVVAINAQKSGHKIIGAPETVIDNGQFQGAFPDYGYGDSNNNEALNRVEKQLFATLELLQAYREALPMPLKFAEKRRNKFEFIRFGRR